VGSIVESPDAIVARQPYDVDATMEGLRTSTVRPYWILPPEEHAVLGESEFGMPGLLAVEAIGPFVEIQASGPLITVHDSIVSARLGIGHHPHRFNERLFYIEQGQLDHDDALNHITGHMDTWDVGQFTEGRRGMMHSEWNHGDVDTRAYILVYSTDPVPPQAAFSVLRDAEAPRYEEAAGVRTKELVGPRSPLTINGDIRLFTDSELQPGAVLALDLASGEGGLASVREGGVHVEGDGAELLPGATLLAPPAGEPRTLRLRTEEPTRLVRVVHGPGHGLVRGSPA
jgi:redox-sensitive bicupin YhaK (pirin superfamily)